MTSKQVSSMAAFGENLRREREMRGVSLEEIAAATKISLRLLQAIEQEDFARLPGGIFARSFIRSYARYLGLEEDRVIAEYQLAAHPSIDIDLVRLTPTSRTPATRTSGRSPLVATLVAILLLAGGYLLYHYSRRSAEMPTPPLPSTATTPSPAPQGGTSPAPGTEGDTALPGATAQTSTAAPGAAPDATSGANPSAPAGANPGAGPSTAAATAGQTQTLAPQTGTSTIGKLTQDAGLVLQVAATERAWVAIEADGKTVLQRMMNPNEVQTMKARDSFDITAGNAQGIILTLNGETLKPLGRRGEVKTVHLTREDLKPPAP